MQGDFFSILNIDVNDRAPHIVRMLRAEIGGVVIEGVVSPHVSEQWSERLDRGELPARPTPFAAEFEAHSIGPCLDQCEGRFDEYLERAARFDAALAASSPIDVFAPLHAALARIAGDYRPTRPRGPGDRLYGFVTLRRLPPGGRIPPHCENEQIPRVSYDDLRPRIDAATLISFYLTLRPADEGGELAVYDLGYDAIGDRVRHRHSAMEDEVARVRRVLVKPPAGSLIVFDGGRRFHEVLPVGGARARWTLGGFLAASIDHQQLYVWA